MRLRPIFITLFLLLGTFASAVVIPDMKFRRLDTRDGLSNSQVNCIYKDSRGFVWIGTSYGLNRYDGYRVKTFYSNRADSTSLRDNYVEHIFEAYDGKLWIKQGMNYCIYDPTTESFERNVQRELEKFGIKGGIDRIFIDSKKNFWVKLYEQGLYYYNPYSKKLNVIKYGYNANELNPTYSISSIADQGSTTVMATNNGDLLAIDGERGRIVWENKWMQRNGGMENKNYRLRIDTKGNLWVVTEPNTFIYIQKQKKWYNSLNAYIKANGIQGAPENLQIWDIIVDHRGWIWAATDHEGLIVIDPRGRQLRQFENSKFDETSVNDNTLRELYMDNENQLWIGFYRNGLCQYKESSSHFRSIELGEVNTVCEDRYGNYWVGTNDQGIIVYDPRTNERLQHYTVDNSGLSSNIMVGSCVDLDGTIWFGSYNGGLVHVIPTSPANRGAATIVNIRATGEPQTLANNNVWDVATDKWGRLWIATLGSGIQMLDKKTGKYKTWNTRNSVMPSDYMTNISWTAKGWLMVGHDVYYSIINPVSGKLINGVIPEDPALTSHARSSAYIIEDSRGLLWQGANSGAYILDPKTKRVTLLDMTKGLYGSSVCSITEDRNHAVWVVTDHGVSRIVLQQQDGGEWKYIVRSFDARDGLQPGTYNFRSVRLTRNGQLLVGGQGGLDIIDPQLIASNNSREVPLFSGLQLAGRDVAVGEEIGGRVILKEALDESHQLSLRKSENNFTIQLGSNAATIGYSHRFAYKLDGMDDSWTNTSANNPNITYMSLPSGRYTLRVRMLNDDGTRGNIESVLKIRIATAWYFSWWSFLLYAVMLAVAFWWSRKRFIEKEAERMELERVRRETEKHSWMNQMRQQMIREGKLSVQHATTDDVTLDRRITDIVAFVRKECSQFKPDIEKDYNLTFNTKTEKAEVKLDSDRFAEALHIMLNNSLRFSPAGCKISVTIDEPHDGKINILVADNGVGIQDEYKAIAFDTVVDGDGIGLDRVKTIVTAHHGDISLDDNPGGGTVFNITLPVEQVEIEEAVLMDDSEE